MDVIVELFFKYIPALLAAFGTVVTLWRGWVYSSDRVFEQREKSSRFIYELYKISEEEHLKKLSIEYGYAAITRDDFLDFSQRKALLTSNNPTRDIDAYRKCSNLLTITCNPLRFEWVSKRYRYKCYRLLVKSLRVLIYAVGAYGLTLPLTYKVMLSVPILDKIGTLAPITKFLIVMYLIIVGGFLAAWNLNEISKLRIAEDLRKNHLH
ncbi:hypothetical protein AB6870_11480 [Rahnella inusitata]|uniref:hypothetical protein n=1 Tax=Rahnella inusitata TaxID=58169 RepID=UPI0039BEA2A1